MTPQLMKTTAKQRTEPKGSESLIVDDVLAGDSGHEAIEYPVELIRDEDSYVASHPDLPGCVSFGEDPNRAVQNLAEVKKLWIEGQLASGNTIPEPSSSGRYSGKFVLRIPKQLHKLADHRSRQEGVSLNSYISYVLAGALAYPSGSAKSQDPWERTVYWHEHLQRNVATWFRDRCELNWSIRDRPSKAISRHYLATLTKQIGNSSKSTFKPEIKEFAHAEEKYHVATR
jgi:antitoxin HicB